MTNTEFFSINLPKWPGLLVKGQSVTEEQAMEILIRTDNFSFSCNDREWIKLLSKEVYDIEYDGWDLYQNIEKQKNLDWNGVFKYIETCNKKYSVIEELYYLSNSRIASCWIGGPKGWCDWKGKIFTANYNIGKWPSIEEVYNEWCIIAKEFPFLDLRAQLLNGETCEETSIKPLIEFIIKDGKVEMIEPIDQLLDTIDVDYSDRWSNPFAERGCTFEQFKKALDYVQSKYAQ